MGLQRIEPKISYRSDAGHVVDDFYVPCMSNVVLYRRAVGYFISGSLSLAARDVSRLIKSGRKIQLITSPQLSADNSEAIEKGYESRGQRIRKLFEIELEQLQDELERERLSALARLVSIDALEIKLALRVDSKTGKLGRGIHHEKNRCLRGLIWRDDRIHRFTERDRWWFCVKL